MPYYLPISKLRYVIAKPEKLAASKCRWHRRAQSRPEEILSATLDVLTEQGYRATRLDDVAAKAGVTKPLIYHYFEGKDDLVRKAMEWRLGQVMAAMREELGTMNGGWEERISQFCRWQWSRWIEPAWGAFHQGVLAEIRQETPDLHKQWIRLAYSERCKVVEEILSGAKGQLRGGVDPVNAARFLIGGLWQTVLHHVHEVDRRPARAKIEAMLELELDIFLAGVRRGPEER